MEDVRVRKARAWLVAPIALVGLVVGTGRGRSLFNRSVHPLASTGAPANGAAANQVSCFDTSPHKRTLVTVAPDVRLEVLDWGGAGEPMVLLTGLGDNAHVYDEFAYQFTDRFRVIGITRRGFGRSSHPASGYDLGTRAHDDIAVLDSLSIPRAVFVGHSVAGTELSRLAADYPDRVEKLVYLDALDIGSGGWVKLPQPPRAPELTRTDLESVQRLAAESARDDGFRRPLAATCDMIRTDPSGRVVGPTTPAAIPEQILAGLQPADYLRIRAPALGIFNRMSPRFRTPYYESLNPVEQDEFNRSVGALTKWVADATQRFRSEVKGSRVVELDDTNHYVYFVDEPLVVREMRSFLLPPD